MHGREKGTGTFISIHAPPRGATSGRTQASGAGHISIHAPPRGATNFRQGRKKVTIFQFTPLREGRLVGLRVCGKSTQISIHAPPRGATKAGRTVKIRQHISIHAPPRGATACANREKEWREIFQFTPLREGRQVLEKTGIRLDFISIHAPPRGATSLTRRAFLQVLFQFTPLREGRPMHSPAWRGFFLFQFTPLREGRPVDISDMLPATYFNSRPSARGDSKRYAISANLLFNPYKSAWLNNNATQFVEIILVIFHRIIA